MRSAKDLRFAPFSRSVFSRFVALACILAAECVTATNIPHPWLPAKTLAVSCIVFGAALLLFGQQILKAVQVPAAPVNPFWTALHAIAVALFAAANYRLLVHTAPSTGLGRLILCTWYLTLVLLPITLAGALFGLRAFTRILISLGTAWPLAAVCTLLAVLARVVMIQAWNAPDSHFGRIIQSTTFAGVATLLGLFRSDIVSEPATSIIGTGDFTVQIAGRCSGIEGLALMLGLTVGWLFYSRRELRLTRAWLLVPSSLIVIWLCNMVRIACLIVIGDAGYPAVADGGFHSQAGWILFSVVALCFFFFVNSVAWFRAVPDSTTLVEAPTPEPSLNPLAPSNTAAVYLLPFLAILAASFLSGAASSGFEWLYGLRLLAAAAFLFAYRKQYCRMDWRFGWLGPTAGIVVFILWITFDHWTSGPTSIQPSALAQGLASLSPIQRTTWITLRVLAALITVPIAEELAFHGYLARRIVALDVEAISYRRLTPTAILGSALTFGILHGRMWPAGIAAGVIYALVARTRGRLGEAIAAHTVTNLLLAVYILAHADYALW